MKTPKLGMGVTYSIGSDSYPYAITRVVSPTVIEIAEAEGEGENPSAIKGADTLTLKYFHGRRRVYKRNPATGRMVHLKEYGYYYIGKAESYLDPSF